jgi:hypothetical protein
LRADGGEEESIDIVHARRAPMIAASALVSMPD